MSDNNNVWVITREDSVDLNPHIAVFDSAIKANKVFKEIAEEILDGEPADEDDNTLEQCVEKGFCRIDSDAVRLEVYELNDASQLECQGHGVICHGARPEYSCCKSLS